MYSLLKRKFCTNLSLHSGIFSIILAGKIYLQYFCMCFLFSIKLENDLKLHGQIHFENALWKLITQVVLNPLIHQVVQRTGTVISHFCSACFILHFKLLF